MRCTLAILAAGLLSIAGCNPQPSSVDNVVPEASVLDPDAAPFDLAKRVQELKFLPDGAPRWRPPQIKYEKVEVGGRKAPEELRTWLARNTYGPTRRCYEAGVENDKTLAGKIVVRFAIGNQGKMSDVRNAGSDLPDKSVVECIVAAWARLPSPEADCGTATIKAVISLLPPEGTWRP